LLNKVEEIEFFRGGDGHEREQKQNREENDLHLRLTDA
jgi:hypothetical protein